MTIKKKPWGRPALLAACCLAATIDTALATHSTPTQAKKVTVDLVRAYDECTSPTYWHWGLGVPACAPATLPSSLLLGPNGKGKVTIKVLTPASGPPDLKITAKITDVTDSLDSPYTGYLEARPVVRITDHNCVMPGVCSTVAGSAWIPVVCKNGKCSISVKTSQVIPGSFVSGQGTQLEILDFRIFELGGVTPFLRAGIFVP